MVFAEGSLLERVGAGSFCRSGLEEITLSDTLKEVEKDAFKECHSLRAICLEGQQEVDIAHSGLPDAAEVIFLSVTLPGGALL